MTKGLIVAGGNFPNDDIFNEYINSVDIIIAADRGYDYLKNKNVNIDFLMGDFDSLKSNFNFDNGDFEIIEFPAEKDVTDMEIAIDKVIELRLDEVIIFGATGTRMDHTLVNLILLKKLYEANIRGIIVDNNNKIELIKGIREFPKDNYKFISIIPLENSITISIEGVKYPLDNVLVSPYSSLCISNEIKEDRGVVSVSDYALVIKSND